MNRKNAARKTNTVERSAPLTSIRIARKTSVIHNHNARTCTCTAPQKNDTDVAHYKFNAHQPIIVIFRRDVAERVC